MIPGASPRENRMLQGSPRKANFTVPWVKAVNISILLALCPHIYKGILLSTYKNSTGKTSQSTYQGTPERFSRLILPRLAISLRTPAHPTLITTGSKVRSCDWLSFKMNRPHLAYTTFYWNSNGKIKKHISFRLQKDQGCCCLSSDAYEVAIHDLVIDLAVQCTCPGPWGTAHRVCVSLFRHSNRGLITKGTIGSPVGKRPPFAKRVQNIWEVLRKC